MQRRHRTRRGGGQPGGEVGNAVFLPGHGVIRALRRALVITSYSIHYTKLYEIHRQDGHRPGPGAARGAAGGGGAARGADRQRAQPADPAGVAARRAGGHRRHRGDRDHRRRDDTVGRGAHGGALRSRRSERRIGS